MAKAKGLGARTVKPRTETIRVCTDGEVVGRLRQLEADLVKAERDDDRANRTPLAPKIAKQIRQAEAEADEATVELLIRGMGDTAWRKLIAAHPPTAKQRDEAKKAGERKPDHDPDTFPYAAVAACIVAVNGEEADEDEESVRAFFDPLPRGEFSRVWTVTLAVNVGDNSVPFSSRASRHLTGSEPSSTSAEPTE